MLAYGAWRQNMAARIVYAEPLACNSIPICTPPPLLTLTRCLRKEVIHPDEAEQLMHEVCALGDLQPNHTTLTLLAEIRMRFEQLVCQ